MSVMGKRIPALHHREQFSTETPLTVENMTMGTLGGKWADVEMLPYRRQ
jgi:hypothetical protein